MTQSNFIKVPNPSENYLIHIDLETGGLNTSHNDKDPLIPEGKNGAQHYAILQIAVIVTDGYLNEVGEPLDIVIHHSNEYLDKHVGEWSKNQFKDTLMKQCPSSTVSLKEAEKMVLSHIKKLGVEPKKCFMSGNSIFLDRSFISEQMSELDNFMHYRQLDVSSFKVAMGMLYGDQAYYKKQQTHDALEDIRESIAEIKFFVEHFFTKENMSPVIESKEIKNSSRSRKRSVL